MRQCPLFATMWKDTKFVSLLSSFVGTDPVGSSRCFNWQTKNYKDVPTPARVVDYHQHIVYMNLMNSCIGCCRIMLQSLSDFLSFAGCHYHQRAVASPTGDWFTNEAHRFLSWNCHCHHEFGSTNSSKENGKTQKIILRNTNSAQGRSIYSKLFLRKAYI